MSEILTNISCVPYRNNSTPDPLTDLSTSSWVAPLAILSLAVRMTVSSNLYYFPIHSERIILDESADRVEDIGGVILHWSYKLQWTGQVCLRIDIRVDIQSVGTTYWQRMWKPIISVNQDSNNQKSFKPVKKTNRGFHTSISKWLNSRFPVLIVKARIKRTMKINYTPNNTN